ncbi:MAG: methyltransferase domain-containing protein [Verrucomicrobia bacterium]|nr:methyltransferase domain-containing protein [Verrucomicrobiota bacterium]
MAISIKSISSLAVFSGELLSNAGSVGAAVPSSRALARRIASFLPRDPTGLVIELGAGTGAVTEALIEHGLPLEKIVPVELNANMARHLRKRFPGLNVLGGDASKLGRLLAQHLPDGRPAVSHIVSSLPLRSLPVTVVARIIREVKRLLPPDGTFIQYTYHIGCRRYRPLDDFQRHATSLVWMNLPPARVDVFRVRR